MEKHTGAALTFSWLEVKPTNSSGWHQSAQAGPF